MNQPASAWCGTQNASVITEEYWNGPAHHWMSSGIAKRAPVARVSRADSARVPTMSQPPNRQNTSSTPSPRARDGAAHSTRSTAATAQPFCSHSARWATRSPASLPASAGSRYIASGARSTQSSPPVR